MKHRRGKQLIAIVVAVGLLALGLSACSRKEDDKIKLGILQYATHAALDAAREGFLDTLKANGYEEGKNLKVTVANGEGDQPTIRAMAQQFSEDSYDLILAIATPAAQAMANVGKDTPVLVTAVTDPVSAKLVASLDKPGGNVTGTSDYVSIETQLDLVRSLVPGMKTLGIMYNSGEENSLVQVAEVKKYSKDHNLTLVEASPTNSSEVLQAAQSLIGKVDALYVPTDNTVISAFEAVVKVCNEEKIPLFPGDGDSVARGGVATAGIDYYALGEMTGEQALKILDGTKPGDIPVGLQEETSVIVNLKAAEIMGVHIPKAVLDTAVDIIEK